MMLNRVEHTIDYQFLPKTPLEVYREMIGIVRLKNRIFEHTIMFWLMSKALADVSNHILRSNHAVSEFDIKNNPGPCGIVIQTSLIVEANSIELRSIEVPNQISVISQNVRFKR